MKRTTKPKTNRSPRRKPQTGKRRSTSAERLALQPEAISPTAAGCPLASSEIRDTIIQAVRDQSGNPEANEENTWADLNVFTDAQKMPYRTRIRRYLREKNSSCTANFDPDEFNATDNIGEVVELAQRDCGK